MAKITKAVIPAAGIGSRFLPWTKAMPKEMLPIVDRPVLQYVVEECVNSGIKQIVIVTRQGKEAIKNYFTPSPDLRRKLQDQGKGHLAEKLSTITKMAKFTFVNQTGAYGNATPVLAAERAVADEPFAVLWGDQFIWAKPPRLKQCLEAFNQQQAPVIAGIRVAEEEIPNRGMCQVKPFAKNLYQLERIIEKPRPEESPSDLAAYGTYLLTPDIFPILADLKPGRNGELWLVEAINQLAENRQALVLELKNARLYDAGNKLNYCKTFVDFMIKDPDIGQAMKQYLKERFNCWINIDSDKQ